ncbi:hypothetical protein JCM19238_2706 [Vibrio ponticus]|nr:hypothetical protein JCM19238_2706 [Vibrio ponticus]
MKQFTVIQTICASIDPAIIPAMPKGAVAGIFTFIADRNSKHAII